LDGHRAVLISSANTLGKPARCQRITVSGLTIFKASRTPVPADTTGKYQTVDAAEA